MGHDRDGEIRRQLQILQPERGLQFFAGFRWLLQADSFTARTGPPPLAIRASACLWTAGVSLWLSATGAVLKRRAVVQRVKDVVAIMFRPYPRFDVLLLRARGATLLRDDGLRPWIKDRNFRAEACWIAAQAPDHGQHSVLSRAPSRDTLGRSA
jgi:uncharacterized protein (DUF1684 family)